MMKVLIWNYDKFGKAKLLLQKTLFDKYDVTMLAEAKRDNELLVLKAKYHHVRSAGDEGGGLTVFVRTIWYGTQVQKLWKDFAMMDTNCTVGQEKTTGKMLKSLASYFPMERTQCKVSSKNVKEFEKGFTVTQSSSNLDEAGSAFL